MTSSTTPVGTGRARREWVPGWLASIRRLLDGRDLAVGYALVVLVVTVALMLAPAWLHDEVVQESSTNLTNLHQHPVDVLIVSAFVLESPVELVLLPLLVWGYGAVQRWLGRAAAVITGVFGHVGATLFVAFLIATGITRGYTHVSAAWEEDVGVSYGLAAVGGLVALRVPARWRLPYLVIVGGGLAGSLLIFKTFTDVGHLTALGIGTCIAVLVRAAAHSARPLVDLPPATGTTETSG